MARKYRGKKTVRRRRGYMKRKRVRRIRSSFGKPTTVNQKELIIADRSIVKLRYISVDDPTLNPSAVLPYTFKEWRLNGLYDIDPALASSAITGFTPWGVFYQNYRAIRAYIKVTVINPYATPIYFIMAVFNPNDILPINWSEWMQTRAQQYSKIAVLEGNNARSSRTITMSVPFADILGNRREYTSDTSFSGTTATSISGGANPGNIFPLYIVALNFDGASALPTQIPYRMEITYSVEFFTRTQVPTI